MTVITLLVYIIPALFALYAIILGLFVWYRRKYPNSFRSNLTDCRLASYYHSLVQKNFNPSAIVTIFNGETDQAKRKRIVDSLKNDYSSEDNAGEVLVNFTTKDSKATEVTTLAGHDLADQYNELQKTIQQNILSGHNVPSVLFKIKTEGQLGNRSELIEAHELFLNEYVEVKQQSKKNMKCILKRISTGISDPRAYNAVIVLLILTILTLCGIALYLVCKQH